MADELIDILDKNGKPTREVRLKSEAHQLGLYHSSVHIWLYTKEGNLLFQKRSNNKDTFPNLWDVSVAGHIGTGESAKESALREIQEEIGISVAQEDLEFIRTCLAKKRPRSDIFDNEFHHVFISELKVSLDELTLQKEEVSDIKLMPLAKLKQLIQNTELSKAYVPHGSTYFEFVLGAVLKKLKAYKRRF
ncbi:NUDIX hydrolase [Aquimarina sp. M1]